MKEINEDYSFNSQLKVEKNDGSVVGVNEGARPYKVYSALLTQAGTNAPVATVLENTLGEEIVWAYNTQGQYAGDLTNGFPDNKTVLTLQNIRGNGAFQITAGTINSISEILVLTYEVVIDEINFVDDVLNKSFIEIRVYP